MKFLANLLLALSLLTPLTANADERIHGHISSIQGPYDISVNDSNGYTDRVHLHHGTIINPTGLTLAPGMIVDISGFSEGRYFEANEIDTPYTYYNENWYYGGHLWNYYGPAVGIYFGDERRGHREDGNHDWNRRIP
jgi:hypothetical protein